MLNGQNRLFESCLHATVALAMLAATGRAQTSPSLHQATLMEADQKTKEISTEELRRILADKSAVVFDARPAKEYAVSHIPGALNVSAKPGVPMSMYVSDVAEIGRTLGGDKTRAIVLYCNGPFCGKSKRLATELLHAGYTNVRRYQLGIPVDAIANEAFHNVSFFDGPFEKFSAATQP